MRAAAPPDPPPSAAAETDGVWYHTIDLPDGTVTPGVFDNRPVAAVLHWPPGLVGGRCLDVGTCDGFWAFEMERRGAAEVLAVDVDDPTRLDLTWDARQHDLRTVAARAARRRGRFDSARRALGSRVERLACSVYDLDPAVHGRFDVVFCGTLLMHLRDPVRALERMRDVCAGELVVVECVDAFLDLFGRWVPAARLAPAPGHWWRSNRAGLRAVLGVAGFEVVSASRRFLTPYGPGAQGQGPGWRRRWAALRVAASRWPALSRTPVLVDAVGLVRGFYDTAIHARPRAARPA